MKENLIIPLSLFLTMITISIHGQTQISSKIIGQNYWMPKHSNYNSLGNSLNGMLQSHWSDIQNSGVKYIRIGGKDYDKNKMFNNMDTLAKIIDNIRMIGAEPIIQMPIKDNISLSDNVNEATLLITRINIDRNKGVKYWVIGNEPDGAYTKWNVADSISKYIKGISPAMKAVDGSIKIIGPSITAFNPSGDGNMMKKFADPHYNGTNNPHSAYLLGSHSTYGPYIDAISFHIYPFRDTTNLATITRNDVISYLRSSGRLKDDLNSLNTWIFNAGRTSNLTVAITEANFSFQQRPSDRSFSGLGPGSFIAGQFLAEMFSVAMEEKVEFLNWWSVREGTSSDNYLSDIGYIRHETGTKRSAYFHFKQMAENFSGTYYQGITSGTNLKAFASKGINKIAVMILNQDPDSLAAKAYTIRLDGVQPTSPNYVKLDIGIGLNGPHSDSIKASSTSLLIFDCQGNMVKNYRYEQTDPNSPFKLAWHLGSDSIADQLEFNAYPSAAVYYDIVIGTASSVISVNTLGPHVFKSVNTITVNGEFTVPLGETLDLYPTSANCN